MPDWAITVNDWLFRFVTRGAPLAHVLAFLPIGLVAGMACARWSARLIARESAGTRQLGRTARAAIIASTAVLYPALILAVIHGRCQGLVEGGSIDWAHWRLLYHDVLLALLVVSTAIDFDQYLIPDEITISGCLVGVLAAALFGNLQLMPLWVDWNNADPIYGPFIPDWIKSHSHLHGLAFSIAGLVAGAGVTWLARWIANFVLGVEALGFGDVTLMAMIGSFLGWQPVLFVFLLAPACAVVMGLVSKLLHGRRAIPFGPYLGAATVIVLFTWRWLWIPTRDVFGHWPTLLGLGGVVAAGLVGLLGLVRLYRAIPVSRRGEHGPPRRDNQDPQGAK